MVAWPTEAQLEEQVTARLLVAKERGWRTFSGHVDAWKALRVELSAQDVDLWGSSEQIRFERRQDAARKSRQNANAPIVIVGPDLTSVFDVIEAV